VGVQNQRFDDPGLTTPMSAFQIGAMQPFPAPGKLSARRDAAKAMARTSDRHVELIETRIALEVERSYWRLSYAEAALDVTRKSERVINSLTDAVHARFSVAQAAQQDGLQAQTAHSRVRADLRGFEQQVVSARRTLNAAVGRAPTASLGRVAPPPDQPRKLDRRTLLARLRETNPALVMSRTQVAAAGRVVEAAKAERWPDFQAGFVYSLRRANPGDMTEGADMFGITIGMTLPIWMSSKQNAFVRETHARHQASGDQLRNVELAVTTELERLIDVVERLDEQIVLYEKEVTKQADAALNASIEDYTFARVGFVALLQNWQMDLDAGLALVRLRAERAERRAEIDALAGIGTTEKR
jgi:outer membrane protein TolC